MNWDEFKSKRLSDEGTRYLHYSELISVWEEGVDMIAKRSYIGKDDQEKMDRLTSAIELLRNTLDGMSEYREAILGLRKLVDLVPPDATTIPDGRGTKLKLRLGNGYEELT